MHTLEPGSSSNQKQMNLQTGRQDHQPALKDHLQLFVYHPSFFNKYVLSSLNTDVGKASYLIFMELKVFLSTQSKIPACSTYYYRLLNLYGIFQGFRGFEPWCNTQFIEFHIKKFFQYLFIIYILKTVFLEETGEKLRD